MTTELGADTMLLGEAAGPVGPPGRPTVGLVMVVKDEQETVGRCLASVRGHVSCWTVCDPGSTDGTPQAVGDALSGLPGHVKVHDWVGFGFNRTRAVQEAKKTADWLLMLDADMTVSGSIPEELTADAYFVRVVDRTGFEYRLPLLLRATVPWAYHGRTHEYLDAPVAFERADLDSFVVTHHLDGNARPEKSTRDVAQLRLDASRSLFYLAQTLREAGDWQGAVDVYRLRIALGGWDEEVWYSRFQLGCLLCANVSFEQGAPELLAAIRQRPGRAEPYRALANSSGNVADKIAVPDDLLFIDRSCYLET